MYIQEHEPALGRALVEACLAEDLVYGAAEGFTSLVAPSSTVLHQTEATALAADLPRLWRLYETLNTLYLAAVAGRAAPWLQQCGEAGLTPAAITAQRLVAAADLQPHLCRVDYVTIGATRQIAEVQWKSGGLGLFFGLHDHCTQLFPFAPATQTLGDLVQGTLPFLQQFVRDGIVVCTTQGGWVRGEHFLHRRYGTAGLAYLPLTGADAIRRLFARNGRYFLADGPKLRPVDLIYDHKYVDALPPAALVKLAQATVDRRVWLETPLNYLYRQKWGLALPFHPDYRACFSDEERAMLIPALLLYTRQIDFTPILNHWLPSEQERLAAVTDLDDLASLPSGLRNSLVIKCGAGTGDYHSKSKGVFRLSGSRAAAQKVIDLVKGRILGHHEPWLLQKYVNQTYPIRVAFPASPEALLPIDAHARFMIYGGRREAGTPVLLGGLANYGREWKIGGKAPGRDTHGYLQGTAFHDLRYAEA